MNPIRTKNDRDAFLKALLIWDRPERDLFGKPLSSDTNTDAFLDQFFTSRTDG